MPGSFPGAPPEPLSPWDGTSGMVCSAVQVLASLLQALETAAHSPPTHLQNHSSLQRTGCRSGHSCLSLTRGFGFKGCIHARGVLSPAYPSPSSAVGPLVPRETTQEGSSCSDARCWLSRGKPSLGWSPLVFAQIPGVGGPAASSVEEELLALKGDVTVPSLLSGGATFLEGVLGGVPGGCSYSGFEQLQRAGGKDVLTQDAAGDNLEMVAPSRGSAKSGGPLEELLHTLQLLEKEPEPLSCPRVHRKGRYAWASEVAEVCPLP
ncbi:hypothetical protein P7K49_012057 [Saguinus oedipus]|uniref:Uncharacterized protein n=1 Tax=Saguinus oedipus TaxID=9490 RepID=A0ABQ9VSF4_SAGOE|nr:hypothetical protein P7K49_012057 [Saguinus oedipus]